ncbi:MAG: hypothetical protein RMI79_06230 [Nitrososphaerota archaeon]|nr:hypothetical protein [Nitrososphaerota archaeon]
MTKKGFKSALFREEVYNKALEFIEEVNRKAGYKKIRSLAHLLDMAVAEYLERHKDELGK